jgi:hypothetical protein
LNTRRKTMQYVYMKDTEQVRTAVTI